MYHSRTEDEVLGAGSAGPGKTFVLIHDFLAQLQVEHERCLLPKNHEHYHPMGSSVGWALYLRRTTPRLEHSIALSHRIFPQVDPGAKWVGAPKNTWTFSSGYKFQFGHCSERQDWEQYASFEFSRILWDELVEFEKEQWDEVNGRCRSSDPIMRRMKGIRAMSNPVRGLTKNDNITISDPQWVRKYFVEPWPEGKRPIRRPLRENGKLLGYHTRLYLPATLDDNPNKEFVEDYKRTLLGKPEHIRQALLYGNWWVTAGSFYGTVWSERLHVCKPFRIPKDWPRFRSMDWGFKVPGCIHWWAMDPDGNIYCERELTFQEKTDAEVAQMVREIEKDAKLWDFDGSMITGPADTQLWEKRGDSGKSKAEVFAEHGINWTKADKLSRESNAERLIKRFKDIRGGTPGIVFFSTCKRAITTIPGIQTDHKNPNCPADGGEDHWHDSVLYACSYASRGDARLSRIDDDDWGSSETDTVSLGTDGYGGL